MHDSVSYHRLKASLVLAALFLALGVGISPAAAPDDASPTEEMRLPWSRAACT